MTDLELMKRALRLAEKGRGRTSPNPMVGAVAVKDGKIISEGWHERAGLPHAEAIAIQKAGEGARGATLYVTLEPCCHTAKRTPPCVRGIIEAGIKKVVAAMADPNPRVSGKGFEALREAEVEVEAGLFEKEARRLNEAYIKHITTGRPFVTMKVAMSLDGKIATRTGDSKWITGERARRLVHRMRGDSDVVLTACGTVVADNPQLTARIKGAKSPIRVIIDPELKSPPGCNVFTTPPQTIVVSKRKLPKELEEKGVKALNYKGELSLNWLMEGLGRAGVTSVLIEGGSSLTGHAIEEGIVDKVVFFIAPVIVGGREAFPAVGGLGVEKIKDSFKVKEMRVRRVGEDLMVEGWV